MTHEIEHNHNADPAEQLSLLSHWELAALRSSSASQPRKSDVASRKARRLWEVDERFIKRAGATQLKFPGF